MNIPVTISLHTKSCSISDAWPHGDRLRRLEASVAGGRLGVRYSKEREYIATDWEWKVGDSLFSRITQLHFYRLTT